MAKKMYYYIGIHTDMGYDFTIEEYDSEEDYFNSL